MSIFGVGYIEQAVRTGTAYRLAIFRQTITAAQNVKLLLTNPSGSGVNMVVVSTTTDSYATVIGNIVSVRNPTGGLPTTALTTAGGGIGIINPLNNSISRVPVVTAAAEVALVTNAYSGGIVTQMKPMYSNGQTKGDETIVILKPGSQLAVQFGGGAALDFAYNLIWCEEPI